MLAFFLGPFPVFQCFSMQYGNGPGDKATAELFHAGLYCLVSILAY